MICLDENRVLDLAQGHLAPAELDATEQHLDSCPSCRQVLAGLLHGDAAPDYSQAQVVQPQHYIFQQELDRGGMGRIVVAHDRRLGRDVAVKELRSPGPAARRRFEREIRVTSRLQHPAIINLYEAGVWPGGEPFYSMTLVRGRSLGEVITQTSGADGRLALLPHLISVADAIAYAHAQGVVHRDLTPRNVLVGTFGETVVIDWGLARELRRPEADEPAADAPPGQAPQLTAAGTIVGTAAYLSPEVAAGAPADERADVYALGALLYYLLAGRPAYEGPSSEQVITAVRAAPPLPLGTRAPFAPTELVAITERAMHRDPARRYRSAQQLSEDLRRFQTGQLVGAHRYSRWELVLRWARRYRAPLSVGAASLVVLLCFAAVSLASVLEARKDAERGRADAEQLLDYMVFDLHATLTRLGRLDVLAQLADKAEAYYQQERAGTVDELRRRAKALANLATVAQLQGHSEQELRLHGRAVEILSRLPTAAADERDALFECTQRMLFVSEGAPEEPTEATLAAAGEAVRRCDEVAGALASDESVEAFGQAHQTHAALLDLAGRGEDAAQELTSALARLERAQPAPSPRRRFAVAALQAQLGWLHHSTGQHERGERLMKQALAERTAVAALDPTNLDWQLSIAESHDDLGKLAIERLEFAESLQQHRRSLDIVVRLAAADPTNVWLLREVAFGHTNLAKALIKAGEPAAGALELQRALDADAQLTVAAPDNRRYRADLTTDQSLLGNQLLAAGDAARALQLFERVLAERQADSAAAPAARVRRQAVALAHVRVAEALTATGATARALEEFKLASAIDEELLAAEPARLSRALDAAIGHRLVGDALMADQRALEAVVAYQRALALRETALGRDESNRASRQEVVLLRLRVAGAVLHTAAAGSAAQHYQLAVDGARELARREPGWAAGHLVEAEALEKQALEFSGRGDFTRARSALQEALVAVTRGSASADAPEWRVQVQAELADAECSVGNGAVAKSLWAEACAGFAQLRGAAASDEDVRRAAATACSNGKRQCPGR